MREAIPRANRFMSAQADRLWQSLTRKRVIGEQDVGGARLCLSETVPDLLC